MQHTATDVPAKKRRAALWVLCTVLAVLCAVAVTYYWRVFYEYTAVPAGRLAVCAGALALCGAAAVWACVHLCRSFASRAALAILLCGALFCFANPPMQAPDESTHFLRANAVSMGRFDFDYNRTYPADVNALLAAFPGSYVNANTTFWLEHDEAGLLTGGGSSENYAIKQLADGTRTGIADGFGRYAALCESGDAPSVAEPQMFQVLPYLPQALCMAAARLLGFGALGQLYAGRLANLAVYAALCWLALRNCRRYQTVFLAVMLLPLGLFIAASANYDALVLGCYYLAASYYCKDEITDKDLAVFAAAFLLMNAVKPYINLLWLVLPLILPKKAWKARFKKWQVAAVLLVVAVAAVTKLVDWYGAALRYNYPAVERYLGDAVNQMEQLKFVLANLPRTFMVFVGSLYERGLFLGELGTFGAMDISIPVVQLLSVLMLCLGAALAVHEKSSLTPKSAAGLLGLAVFYVFGVLAAQYITYTPVGLPHVAGVQARYLLPAFLMLFVLAAALLSHVLAPARAGGRRAEGLALSACGAAAAVCAVLLFQHYFVGPVCMVP